MPDYEGLRKRLQVDDPLAPGNALTTLAKGWADWRAKQTPMPPSDAADLSQAQDVPMAAGTLNVKSLLNALGAIKPLFQELQVPTKLQNLWERTHGAPILNSIESHPDWWENLMGKVGGKDANKITFLGTGSRSDAFGIGGGKPEVLKMTPRNAVDPTRSEYLEWAKNPKPGQFPYMNEMDVARLRLPFVTPTVPYTTPNMDMLVTRQRPVLPYDAPNDKAERYLRQMAEQYGLEMKDISNIGNIGSYKGKPVTYDLGAVDVSDTPKFMDWLARNRRKTIWDTPEYETPPPLRNEWREFNVGDALGKLFD